MLQLWSLKSAATRVLALLVLCAPLAALAQSTNNLDEDFTGPTTNNSWFFFNGACLTAGTSAATTNPGQIPSCISIQSSYYKEDLVGGASGYLGSTASPSSADPTGQGALRFTNGQIKSGSPSPSCTPGWGGFCQNGAVVSATPFATGQGISVTFKTVTYRGNGGGTGGDGADGISFYLLDGCMPIPGSTLDTTDCANAGNPVDPTKGNPLYGIGSLYGSVTYPAIGAWGGSLAYTCSNSNSPYDGLVGGYLGLGIDEYGNFLNGTNNTINEGDYIKNGDGTPAGPGDNTASGGYYKPGRIGLRGAGNISWQALTTAYGTDPANTAAPYYPASLATTCSNGGVYSAGSCGPVCPTGFFYNSAKVTCDQCSAGTTFYSGTNKCMSCPSGATYNVSDNSCSSPAFTCPNGATYGAGSCSPQYFCASGTTLNGSNCLKCPSGSSVDTSSGTPYCDYNCPTGTFEGTGQGVYPQMCYKCSKGSLTQNAVTKVWSCSSGGSLSLSNLKTPTSSSATTNTPQPVVPTGVNPTTSTPSTGVPYSLLAVRNTCSTGNLWNYKTPGTPSSAGPATLPTDPTNPNSLNTAGIMDYPALFTPGPPVVGAYRVLSGVQIANESAVTRADAVPIFYNLKITQNGILTLYYSINGGDYTPVINNLDIKQSNGPMPSSFRFGFAGSTGGSTNVHEIMCFKAAPDTLSASSVGVNEKQSQQIQPDTQAFFAYYNPVDSTGRIAAFGVGFFDPSNPTQLQVAGTASWDAACKLTGATSCPTTGTAVTGESPSASSGRQILTFDGSGGVPFQWTGGSTISAAQKTALGTQDELNYLRGVRDLEINTQGVGTYRARDSVLADVVDSSPTWVGPPSSGYATTFTNRLNSMDSLPENSGQTYVQFKSTYQTRQNVVYDGANDGMLHAFRTAGSDGTGTNDGAEVLAYMPNYVIQTIHKVTTDPITMVADSSLDFSSPQYTHNYFVDATPGTGDLFYGAKWHTWLVGGLGAGGSAIYALDITDPTSFKETNAASLVIGEWTAGVDGAAGAISCVGNGATNNVNCGQNLGNTYGTPLIRRLHDGHWGVIFGNGIGSATGDAGIYVMDIDPSDINKPTFYYLSTGQGTAASPGGDGIAAPAAVDLDGDKIVDYVYAGDMKGNLWRFDLTNASAKSWAASSQALFKSAGQPITTIPIVGGVVTAGGFRRVMVAFGTGQRTPVSGTSPITYLGNTQTLYGVWDWDMSGWNALPSSLQFATGTASAPIAPGNLQAQDVELSADGKLTRDINAATVCFQGASDCATNDKFGWSVALLGTSSQGAEQIVSNPTFLNGTIQWNSVLPADNKPTECTTNTDKGWTYDVTLAAGAAVPGFFQQYHDDQEAAGVETDASGTSFLLNAANGSSWLVYQTVTNAHETMQVNLPANNSAKRLTWIQLR